MKAEKTFDIGKREAVVLDNGEFRILVNKDKGMVSELSARLNGRWLNAHWQPWFRYNGMDAWDPAKHEEYWKVPLLFDIAGNFPCCPNFGPGQRRKGVDLPPHGFTSFLAWEGPELSCDESSASAAWEMKPEVHPLTYRKLDLVRKGENVHYMALHIENPSDASEEFCVGWHNTVGAPFLEAGCLICNNASFFSIPPLGTEFDDTGRFQPGVEFESLKKVPLKDGGSADASIVPGVNGFTDFIAGAVPSDCELAWDAVVNPFQKAVYLSWFTGPGALKEDELGLSFYNYWMNYGGRNFQPWAAWDGGTDRSFCLGAENALSYFANGLDEAVQNPVLMGNPTHFVIEPGGHKIQYQATALFTWEGDVLNEGIATVEAEGAELVVTGMKGKYVKIKAQGCFDELKARKL